MPIIGLTDRSPSFKEAGRLRLGIPKSEMKNKGPQEISYFRADFRPDAQDAAELFKSVYTDKPTRINARIPFPQIERCWDAYYMVYNKSGLLGMSDGIKWIYLRHNQTGEILAKDGFPTKPEGLPVDSNGLPYLPFDKSIPVYSYQSSKGETIAVYAKPEGRLKILVPELKQAAYLVVITHSIYNVIRLSEQLAAIEQIAKNSGMPLPMIPLVLSRRKESISVSINGQKTMQEHYLLNIEIDPAWMEAQWKFINTILPGTQPALFQLPEPTPADLSENETGEEPVGQAEPESEKKPALTIAEAVATSTKKGNLLGSLSNEQLKILRDKGENGVQTAAKFLLEPATEDDWKTVDMLPVDNVTRIEMYRIVQMARMP